MSHHPEERLGPYLEGELGPEDRRALELHLARCEACSLALRELRTTVELLQWVPEPLVPAQLGRAVMERIAAGERRPLARWRARFSSAVGSPIPSAVGALAAVALLILAVRAVTPSEAQWVASSRVAELSSAPDEPVTLRSTPSLQAASLRPAATRSLPAPFRPRPERRSGGLGVGAAAPGRSELLPPRPVLTRCQGFGRGADVEGESPGFSCRPWLSGMLTLVQLDPQSFLGEISLLPGGERDAWLAELVGFAARSGSVTHVVAGLRSSPDPGAALLAERFERGTRTAAVE